MSARKPSLRWHRKNRKTNFAMLKAASLKSAIFYLAGATCPPEVLVVQSRTYPPDVFNNSVTKWCLLVSRNHCRHCNYSSTCLKSCFKYQFLSRKESLSNHNCSLFPLNKGGIFKYFIIRTDALFPSFSSLCICFATKYLESVQIN